MTGENALKRKRVVTACSECYRRKQKCNRESPCNNCTLRKIPSQCIYGTIPVTTRANNVDGDDYGAYPQNEDSNHSRALEDDGDEEHSHGGSHSDDDDLGYSTMPGSNAFADLKELLQKELPSQSGVDARKQLAMARKFSKLISKLPSSDVIEKLSSIFFNEANWAYAILERVYFTRMLADWHQAISNAPLLGPQDLSHELRYFPAVLFEVLSIGLHYLPLNAPGYSCLPSDDMGAIEHLSSRFSNYGMDVMSLLGRFNPSVTSVQADFLRASYLKNCGRAIGSWHSLGVAIRQAQEMGMHKQKRSSISHGVPKEGNLESFWYNEYKIRLWTNLFAWDSLMAMILGRPRVINMSDCETDFPLDCDIPVDTSTTAPITGVKPASSFTAAIFRYRLSELLHQIRAVGADKPTLTDLDVLLKLEDQLMHLYDQISKAAHIRNPDTSLDREYPFFPRLREDTYTLVLSFIGVLYRPHIARLEVGRKKVLDSALEILKSQKRIFDMISPHSYRYFGVSFFTIDAAILLSSMAMLYPPKSAAAKKNIYDALQGSISRLKLMDDNVLAKTGVEILSLCYQKAQASLPNDAESPALGKFINVSSPSSSESSLEKPVIVSTTEYTAGPTPTTGNSLDLASVATFQQVPQVQYDPLYDPSLAYSTLDSTANLALTSMTTNTQGIDGMPDVSNANYFDTTYWLGNMTYYGDAPVDLQNTDPLWASFGYAALPPGFYQPPDMQ